MSAKYINNTVLMQASSTDFHTVLPTVVGPVTPSNITVSVPPPHFTNIASSVSMSTRQPSGPVSFPSQGTGFLSAVRPIPSSNLTMSYPLPPKSSLMPSTLNCAGSVLRTRILGNLTSAIQTPATTVWTTAVFTAPRLSPSQAVLLL